MDLVPVLAISLGFVIITPISAFVFSWSPIGRAMTERIKGRTANDSEKLDEVCDAIMELQGTMDHVGADLEDLQDRMAFTERMLMAGAEEKEAYALGSRSRRRCMIGGHQMQATAGLAVNAKASPKVLRESEAVIEAVIPIGSGFRRQSSRCCLRLCGDSGFLFQHGQEEAASVVLMRPDSYAPG